MSFLAKLFGWLFGSKKVVESPKEAMKELESKPQKKVYHKMNPQQKAQHQLKRLHEMNTIVEAYNADIKRRFKAKFEPSDRGSRESIHPSPGADRSFLWR